MKNMPVVLTVVDEKLKVVATLVVVELWEVVVVAELVVVLYVVIVLARVTPRKLEAKSRLVPVQVGGLEVVCAVGGVLHAVTVIR